MTKRNLILFHFISLFPSSSFAIAFLSFQSLLSFCSKVERATNQPQTVQFSYSFDVSFGWVLVSEWLLRVNWLLLLLIVDVDVVVVVNVVVDVVVIVVVIFVVVIFCCCCCCYCHYCCCSLSLLLLSSSLLLLSSSLSSSMSSLLSATFWQKQQLLVRFAGSQDLITLIRWNFHTLLLLLISSAILVEPQTKSFSSGNGLMPSAVVAHEASANNVLISELFDEWFRYYRHHH